MAGKEGWLTSFFRGNKGPKLLTHAKKSKGEFDWKPLTEVDPESAAIVEKFKDDQLAERIKARREKLGLRTEDEQGGA